MATKKRRAGEPARQLQSDPKISDNPVSQTYLNQSAVSFQIR